MATDRSPLRSPRGRKPFDHRWILPLTLTLTASLIAACAPPDTGGAAPAGDRASPAGAAPALRAPSRLGAPIDLGAASKTSLAFRPEGGAWVGGGGTYTVRATAGGFAVSPLLRGARAGARRGAPLAVATERIARGPLELGGTAWPRLEADGQLAIERGAVTERLRPTRAGVELSYGFDRRPAGAGDLTVRLRVSGQAYAGETAGGHHYEDAAGGPGVRVGRAAWIDARGARTDVPARAVDGGLELVVPARAVDGGAYPAVLDPLVSPEISLDASVPNPDFDARVAPSVAFDGQNYLVVWGDQRDANGTTKGARIYGARVSPAGEVLDPAGIAISSDVGSDYQPRAVFDGASTLVIWAHEDGVPTGDDTGGGFEAARVTPEGAVLDAVPIQLPAAFTWGSEDIGGVAAASNGAGTLVTYAGGNDHLSRTIVGQDGSLGPVDQVVDLPQEAILPGGVASDGVGYLATWTKDFPPDLVRGVRLDAAGESVGPGAFDIGPDGANPQAAAAAFDGESYVVVWDGSPPPGLLLFTRVSPGGTVLDPQSVLLATGVNPSRVTVTAGGGRSLVVWSPSADQGAPVPEPQGREIGQDGAIWPQFEIPTSGELPALAAGNDLQVLAAYGQLADDGPEPYVHVMLRFIEPDACAGPADCASGCCADGVCCDENGGGGGAGGGGGQAGAGGGGQAGAGGGQAGAPAGGDPDPGHSSDCGCRAAADDPHPPLWLAASAGILAIRRRRRGRAAVSSATG